MPSKSQNLECSCLYNVCAIFFMHNFSLLDFVTHENPTVSTLFRKKEVNARLDEN